MYMCAGVAFFALDRQTFRSIHFPYPQYATAYSPIVTTTHRNGVDRMSTTVPPPGSPNPHARSCSGISGTASGSRSSDSIRREACGSASATASARGSRSSWTAVMSFEIPATTIQSKGPSLERSRIARCQRDVTEALGRWRGARHVRSEQERQAGQPEDLEDQGDDRRQGGDGAEHRERQDDRQAEVLERRERGHGHSLRPGDVERPRQ